MAGNQKVVLRRLQVTENVANYYLYQSSVVVKTMLVITCCKLSQKKNFIIFVSSDWLLPEILSIIRTVDTVLEQLKSWLTR